MRNSKIGIYVGIILTAVFWGITFVAFKLANQSLQPISIVLFRLVIANIFLFGFAFLLKRLNRIQRKDLKWFILLGVFEPFFYFLGEAFGLTMVSSTVGAVIISTIPLLVPFGSYYFFNERLTATNKLGLLISFSGVMLVVLSKSGQLSATPLGIVLMFFAVFSAV